ncbi:MAG: DNA mismatch repair protein MutS [Thermoprotei archaeon]
MDQMVDEVVKKFNRPELRKFYYTALKNKEDVEYRQAILVDLRNERVLEAFRVFSKSMESAIRLLQEAEKQYEFQREGWFLEGIRRYLDSVLELYSTLGSLPINSEGLLSFRNYLENYITSSEFTHARKSAEDTHLQLARLSFEMVLGNGKITVRKASGGEDYSKKIESLFEKFNEDSDSRIPKQKEVSEANHVEAAILSLLSKIFAEEFESLKNFYTKLREFPDKVLLRFIDELQFYLSYLDYIAPLEKRGLKFCVPSVSDEHTLLCQDGFDVVLAHKLAEENKDVVTNDIQLSEKERIVVITGANSGGKSTFSRMVGQIHYLASLGLVVPGSSACLQLPDEIFTHFEKSEDVENLRGKLEDDMVRIKRILDNSTSRSLIIINEMLSSTTAHDAYFIGREILGRISGIGSLCLYVTFVDELADVPGSVSMVSLTDPSDPTRRTYKVIRMKPNGKAYSFALAKKYRLTYEDLLVRVRK